MTQNSEAGTPRHHDQGQYRSARTETIRMDDSRQVQKSISSSQSGEMDNDWRKGDRSTPRQQRFVNRDQEPKPFASYDDKLAAMEGSWKKNPQPRFERRPHREDRQDRYDRHGPERHERHERHERVERPERERQGGSRSYQHREHKESRAFREQRDYHPDQSHGGISEHASRNSWPGEFRGAKSRSKDSPELHGGDEFKCPLAGKGATHLINVLDKDFIVCPRQDARKEGLPNLEVTAAYLISYVVENLEEEGGDSVECLIYGGEARAIVASEYNVEDPKARPTDLDLRFKIGKNSFESCRDVVEQFLLGRLKERIPNADQSLVRSCYFQKQVVVSSQFSLLSIGDPKTGRNLDLEFTSSECTTRCFFDDANAFVIPLPDPASKGWKNVKPFSKSRGGAASQECVKLMATSQSAPWKTAVEYICRGQLNIAKPETVFNGLPLYAHALSDKQLLPGTRDLEREYGSEFARAFIEQAEDTYKNGQDPLRFLKSFLRSHYPSRPINALACLSQVLAILRAHAALGEITTEREAIAKKLAESLSELCREALQNAASPDTSKDVVDKVLQIVRFAANPFTADYRRDEKVVMQANKSIVLQLRRQISKDDFSEDAVQRPLWEDVCKQAAELMMQKYEQDGEEADSRRADIERVCEALKGLANTQTVRVGKEISADSVEEQGSQYTDQTDEHSAVASCQSLGFASPSSETSLGSSRSEDDDSRSSLSASEETEMDAATTPEVRATKCRKSPQVQVQVDAEMSTPASATASPHGTPTSANRTPNSGNRPRPNWGGGVYRPPARRSTPNTPQS